ncbi:MAG: dephospho-CoA kinase [Hyphomicrobium sp.]
MLIIGLTGSMGMGKSTAAARFRARGIPVFDADAAVHDLYRGPLADDIEAAFPGTTVDGGVDRGRLSAALLAAPEKLALLEGIVHPRVQQAERAFLVDAFSRGAAMAVLEIPLLFEGGVASAVDVTIVVSAPAAMQRARLLDRPGMSDAKLEKLLARQMPDAEKRQRADFIVDTGGSVAACHRQIDDIIERLDGRKGTAFDRHWRARG